MPNPVGYKVQQGIPCCANCLFGGYLGDMKEKDRMCVCEIFGEPDDSVYSDTAVEPLGICDAWKPNTRAEETA